MTDIRTAERQSVQVQPDAKAGEGETSFWSMLWIERGWLLPLWGTRLREQRLREYYRHEYNWLMQSAIAGLIKKVKATPWEISGPPTKNPSQRVRNFQDILRDANFGRGWGDLLSKVLLDFFRQDGGAYIELIAPGNPLRPPTGRVTGIAYLDSLRCYPTGDPEYPVIYYDRKGGKHLMHVSRVVHLVDMADGDERNPGYGLSALSRAISIVSREINMNRFVDSKLDDKPPPGFVVASNINKGERDAAQAAYSAEQNNDAQPPWGKTFWFYSTNPQHPADLKYITFAQAPDNWSFKEYTELDVNAVAAALGTDVQEIWQLTGGNLGSGQQSQILHQKSQGKAYGDILTELTRALNDALPVDMEFEFKRRDAQESQAEANTAQTWVSVARSWQDATPDERRKLLANKVEAIGDAITDANGELIRLQDADVAPVDDTTADDASPNDTAPPDEPPADEQTVGSAKELSTTRRRLQEDIATLVTALDAGDITEAQFRTRVLALALQFGQDAIDEALSAYGATASSEDATFRFVAFGGAAGGIAGLIAAFLQNRSASNAALALQFGIIQASQEAIAQSLADVFRQNVTVFAQRLADGELTAQAWADVIRREIERYHAVQALAGYGDGSELMQALADQRAVDQLRFFDAWAERLIAAGGPYNAQLIAQRAMSYAQAGEVTAMQAFTDAVGLPQMPAYPKDWQTDCKHNCYCRWWFLPLGDGNWDCYWIYDPTRDNCRQCPRRAVVWGPLQVRNGVIQPYDATGLFS